MALEDSYLFVQGPPGAGKTTIGSQLIVGLLRQGKRVGVTSNSHKVINNLLRAVEARASEEGFRSRASRSRAGRIRRARSRADSSTTLTRMPISSKPAAS